MSDDQPGAAFGRYLAQVDAEHPERPRYRSSPARWWHWLPIVAVAAGLIALVARAIGRLFGAW